MPLAYIRLLPRGSAGHPDNALPGYGHPDHGLPEHPIDPGFGGGIGAIPDPGFDIPLPPPGVWPPPNATLPIVPAPPGTPPGAIWPPIGHPPVWSGGVIPPVRPDAGLPPSPGHPSGQPVPPPGGSTKPPSQVFWVVAGIPGVGWRYCAVDPSLVAGTPLPPAPEPK